MSKRDSGSLKVIDVTKYKNTERLCVYNHYPNNIQKINLSAFGREDFLCVSFSTITTSIHFAYHIGAKNIILVGVDHGTLDGKHTFDGYYKNIKESPWGNWDQYKSWLKQLNKDTIAIKKRINQLGTNVYSLNPFINFSLEGHKYE